MPAGMSLPENVLKAATMAFGNPPNGCKRLFAKDVKLDDGVMLKRFYWESEEE